MSLAGLSVERQERMKVLFVEPDAALRDDGSRTATHTRVAGGAAGSVTAYFIKRVRYGSM